MDCCTVNLLVLLTITKPYLIKLLPNKYYILTETNLYKLDKIVWVMYLFYKKSIKFYYKIFTSKKILFFKLLSIILRKCKLIAS